MSNVTRVRVVETIFQEDEHRWGKHRVKIMTGWNTGKEIVMRTENSDLYWEEHVEGYAVSRRLPNTEREVYSLHASIPRGSVVEGVDSIADKAVRVLRKVACILRDHTWEFEDIEVRTLESVGITVEVAKYRCSGCGATMSNALMGGGGGREVE